MTLLLSVTTTSNEWIEDFSVDTLHTTTHGGVYE